MSVLDALTPYREQAEDALLAALKTVEPAELQAACLHYPAAGGKRLRPVMALLACEAAGGTAEDAVPLAVAMEAIHVFSLIHDDIMDRDDLRRGLPTVHKEWDEPTAILAGDTLFALAFETLADARGDPARVTRAVAVVARMARVLCEGQQLDMAFEEQAPSEDDYVEMVYRKTARFFEVACQAGAELAGADEDTVKALARFGKSFGLAFQIRDDVIDFLDASETGKSAFSDIRRGKRTLLVLHALAHAGPRDRAILLNTLGRAGASDYEVSEVVDVFHKTGAVSHARDKVGTLTKDALNALEKLPGTPARHLLADLALWQENRTG